MTDVEALVDTIFTLIFIEPLFLEHPIAGCNETVRVIEGWYKLELGGVGHGALLIESNRCDSIASYR